MTLIQREDNLLREAAEKGDVSFLRNCVDSNKPIEYYLTLFPKTHQSQTRATITHGNIFHLAASDKKEEFIKEAILILQHLNVTTQLILQQRSDDKWSPLHVAAAVGSPETIKLFLSVFSSASPSNENPWLQTNSLGQTPCHLALIEGPEDCALELLKVDMELLCKMIDNQGNSLLYCAVQKGLNEFALKILKSNHFFSCCGFNGFTPLHYVTRCSEGEAICRLLLEKKPELINHISKNGCSILHSWAKEGKPWPFQCLLKSVDINNEVRSSFVNLISSIYHEKGSNPLHLLARNAPNEKTAVQIALLFINAYKQETTAKIERHLPCKNSLCSENLLPWLAKDNEGNTPLSIAIERKFENLAMVILLIDNHALKTYKNNTLLLAISKGCREVAELILEIVNKRGWNELLSDDQQFNALHLAPLCKSKAFIKRLLERCPELLNGISKDKSTILHSWVKIGELWPFEYILNTREIDHQLKTYFAKLICACDYSYHNTPLHVAATFSNEATHEIVKLLVEAYKVEIPNWVFSRPLSLPWLLKNKAGDGIIHLALRDRREKLALYVLSLHDKDHIKELLEYYMPVHKTLFLAIEENCFLFAKEILSRLMSTANWTKYLKDWSNGRNVLHLVATSCTDEEFGRWLVKEAPEYINQMEDSGKTPLEEACEAGSSWFVKSILEKDSSAFDSAPLAWVKACEKGHISVIRVFIDYYPGRFTDHCLQHQDSPLHHIQLRNIAAYEQFLKLPGMKELINVQDAQRATPLHRAIRNRNIFLAETLLNLDQIRYNLKDHEDKTARDLLQEVCKEQREWDSMCKGIGFDPRIKTSYFQHRTNLLDVRNTLSVVAALLATITFTAGFTLPGGFDQGNGEAMLANKAAFLVFLISDALAMCFSMLVLICLIWSMVYDSNKSLFLIDRSMMLLMLALYCTILAFMTGVYVVIAPKSQWCAILIIFICSLLGISANRTILYKVLDKIIPSTNTDPGDRIRLLELGKGCCQGNNCGCLKCN